MTLPSTLRTTLFASALALASTSAGAQPLATASSAGIARAEMRRSRLETFTPSSAAPRLLERSLDVNAVELPGRHVTIEVPSHEAAPPSPFVSFAHNPAAEYFRMRPINGWTWVGLGMGTASLGLSALFLRMAGGSVPSYLPRITGVSASDDPVMLSVGSYALRYDTIGSLTLEAGVSALSNNLMRLVLAPRDPRSVRYIRTYVTELQGGWMFGFTSVM